MTKNVKNKFLKKNDKFLKRQKKLQFFNVISYKLKIKMLKFLISKNGFFDRERLVTLAERSLWSVFACRIFRWFLNNFCKEKKPKIVERKEIHPMERMSEALGHLNTFSRLKFKFTKKHGK
jgi:hypothetical protein